MKLRDFIESYLARRDVTDKYASQLHWLANSFERTIGRPVDVGEISQDLVNRHLKTTRDHLAPETRKSHRRMLLTLWQAAADDGILPDPPRRKIMRIKVPDKLQKAWDVQEVRLLLIGTEVFRGYYQNGIQKRAYWKAYVMGAWDSGLRGVDMRRLRRDAIGERGIYVLVQHKTGRILRVQFREETAAAIEETFPPVRELIWPTWGRLELWRREAKKLVEASGLLGSIGRLRHSSGTAVEIASPGRGHEHLGNTRAVFERHYLDHSKVGKDGTLPERLI